MLFAPAADVHVAWRAERGIALSMSGGLLRVHRHAWYPYSAPECVQQGPVLWPVGLKITPKYRCACVRLANWRVIFGSLVCLMMIIWIPDLSAKKSKTKQNFVLVTHSNQIRSSTVYFSVIRNVQLDLNDCSKITVLKWMNFSHGQGQLRVFACFSRCVCVCVWRVDMGFPQHIFFREWSWACASDIFSLPVLHLLKNESGCEGCNSVRVESEWKSFGISPFLCHLSSSFFLVLDGKAKKWVALWKKSPRASSNYASIRVPNSQSTHPLRTQQPSKHQKICTPMTHLVFCRLLRFIFTFSTAIAAHFLPTAPPNTHFWFSIEVSHMWTSWKGGTPMEINHW